MLSDLSRKNENVINIHRYCELIAVYSHTSSALRNMCIGTFHISQKYNIIMLFMMSVVLILKTDIRNMHNLSLGWDTGCHN
jgi:hypothetical protein